MQRGAPPPTDTSQGPRPLCSSQSSRPERSRSPPMARADYSDRSTRDPDEQAARQDIPDLGQRI
eukprot:5466211-Pyramimonas_sp.AAC.1